MSYRVHVYVMTRRRNIALGPATVWIIGIAIASLAGGEPGLASEASPVLSGVVAVPDDTGVRIEVVLTRAFHYRILSDRDRVVVRLEGVEARAGAYKTAIGFVRGITVRPASGVPSGVDLVIATRTSVDGHTLVIHLVNSRLRAGSARPPEAGAPESAMATSVGLADAQPHLPLEAAPGTGGRTTGSVEPVLPHVLRFPAGSSQLLSVEGLIRVAVSEPRVLGVVPVTNHELLILGRHPGRSTLYVWESDGRLLAYEAEITPEEDRGARLRQLLAALIPQSEITVTRLPAPEAGPRPAVSVADTSSGTKDTRRASYAPPSSGNAVDGPVSPVVGPPAEPLAVAGSPGFVLSGSVATQMDRQHAEEIARAFAPVVINLVTVRRPVQLKLGVRVVELSRSALRELGIIWGGQQGPGSQALLAESTTSGSSGTPVREEPPPWWSRSPLWCSEGVHVSWRSRALWSLRGAQRPCCGAGRSPYLWPGRTVRLRSTTKTSA